MKTATLTGIKPIIKGSRVTVKTSVKQQRKAIVSKHEVAANTTFLIVWLILGITSVGMALLHNI